MKHRLTFGVERMENMANNNWKITCLHYGTLSCYKSLFDGGL